MRKHWLKLFLICVLSLLAGGSLVGQSVDYIAEKAVIIGSPDTLKTRISGLIRLGFEQLKRDDAQSAKQTFQKALSLDSDNSRIFIGLGRSYLHRKSRKLRIFQFIERLFEKDFLSRAISNLKRAVELDPDNWEAHYWLGTAYMRKYGREDLERALVHLERAYELGGDKLPGEDERANAVDQKKDLCEWFVKHWESGQETFERYQAAYPEEAALLETLWAGRLPEGWTDVLPTFSSEDGPLATRKASGAVLNALAPALPTLIGGSADLAPSNNTLLTGYDDFQSASPTGRNLRFGVREHAMGSILNGLALHGGLLPYGGTFMVFSDYMRPPVRLAAMMGLRIVYVWTHDSAWLGEDGPTHQPVEQLAALRAIPNLVMIRPADANETVAAWRVALERRDGPTGLALTRQKLPVLFETNRNPADTVARGAYVLADSSGIPDVLLIASGSEVHLALEARDLLAQKGVAVRVVSMPSWELFDAQPKSYQESVLPPGVTARLAIEAGVTQGWAKYVGLSGDVIGRDRFGASAPYKVLMEKFGFTAEAVAERALRLINK